MKGIVFTEFLEMIEEDHSQEMVDRVIEASNLKSEGAYTSLGTYDHRELIQLVTHLSGETEIPVPDLIRSFGRRLFGRFFELYPVFFEHVGSTFTFVESVHHCIHLEVQKLYSDAELPTFVCDSPATDRLVMTYHSARPLGDLAEGLLLGCIDHFGEDIHLHRENIVGDQGTNARFTLSMKR